MKLFKRNKIDKQKDDGLSLYNQIETIVKVKGELIEASVYPRQRVQEYIHGIMKLQWLYTINNNWGEYSCGIYLKDTKIFYVRYNGDNVFLSVLPVECKEKVITIINKLYQEAIQEKADKEAKESEIEKLQTQQLCDQVTQLCKEL